LVDNFPDNPVIVDQTILLLTAPPTAAQRAASQLFTNGPLSLEPPQIAPLRHSSFAS
jgi:hypothetical protein